MNTKKLKKYFEYFLGDIKILDNIIYNIIENDELKDKKEEIKEILEKIVEDIEYVEEELKQELELIDDDYILYTYKEDFEDFIEIINNEEIEDITDIYCGNGEIREVLNSFKKYLQEKIEKL